MTVKSESEVSQSYPTLSDPTDCSPPGSSIHGIFQARVLEWGAMPSFRDLPDPGNPHLLHFLHWQVDSLPWHHLGKIEIIIPHNSLFFLLFSFVLVLILYVRQNTNELQDPKLNII